MPFIVSVPVDEIRFVGVRTRFTTGVFVKVIFPVLRSKLIPTLAHEGDACDELTKQPPLKLELKPLSPNS